MATIESEVFGDVVRFERVALVHFSTSPKLKEFPHAGEPDVDVARRAILSRSITGLTALALNPKRKGRRIADPLIRQSNVNGSM